MTFLTVLRVLDDFLLRGAGSVWQGSSIYGCFTQTTEAAATKSKEHASVFMGYYGPQCNIYIYVHVHLC